MSAGTFGSFAAGIVAGLAQKPAPKKRGPKSGPRSGEKVRNNSYYEGQLEPRLWRPVGFGKQRGTKRGARRLRGAIMNAARSLELRTRKDRQAKLPGARNGVLGHIGLAVLEALYDFVDFRTGRLEPAIATIAEKVGFSYAAVHNALARLRLYGFLQWIRRSRPLDNEGQVGPQVEQITNAYVLLVPVEFRDLIRRLLWDGPIPDCEQWRGEERDAQIQQMIDKISMKQFHRDFWVGDKVLGAAFEAIAEGIDHQEREFSTLGETRGSF